MLILGIILGAIFGGTAMSIFAVNAYEKGFYDGKESGTWKD